MAVEQLVFTDWPRGLGVDPAATGFQVKACSAGLEAQTRRLVAGICMHHGQAFAWSNAPRAAVEREQHWLQGRAERDAVPGEVLSEFPVVWSYDRIGEDRFALVRAHYLGLTHDGRTGNFSAHALVLPPAMLAAQAANPLAWSRPDTAWVAAAGDGPRLAAVADLGVGTGEPTWGVLRAAPFADHLSDLISALCGASARPLLICLADWRLATPVLDALLAVLPPAARCRTTLSTFETDRTFVPTAGEGRAAPSGGARDVRVLCAAQDRDFNLRPDEYRSGYTVFNFVGNRFSDLDKPRPFAVFAAGCVRDNDLSRLYTLHRLSERLSPIGGAEVWDALVPAAALAAVESLPDALPMAVACLTALATGAAQVPTALALLTPAIQALVRQNAGQALAASAADLGRLADRLPAGEGPDGALGQPFAGALLGLIREALARGHGQVAASLVAAGGRRHDRLLVESLVESCVDSTTDTGAPLSPPPAEPDRQAVARLLLDGLRLADRMEPPPPHADALPIEALRIAGRSGVLSQVWTGGAAALIAQRLGGDWGAEQEVLTQGLLAVCTAERCPEAWAWLSLKGLLAGKRRGEARLKGLVEIVPVAAGSATATGLMDELVKAAATECAEPESLALVLARMAEAAWGRAGWQGLWSAYLEQRDKIEPGKGRKRLRTRFIEAGLDRVLARDLLEDLRPWRGDASMQVLHDWLGSVGERRAPARDALCGQVLTLFAQGGSGPDRLPLAAGVLTHLSRRLPGTPASPDLWNAVLLDLPLAPAPDAWRELLRAAPDGLAPAAAQRLRLLRLLTDTMANSRDPAWTLASFPSTATAWSREVRDLSATQRTAVLRTVLAIIDGVGIVRAGDAGQVIQILSNAGLCVTAQEIAAALGHTLGVRDPVSQVLAVSAFCRFALEDTPRAATAESVGRLLVEDLDKQTNRLLAQHLKQGFGFRSPERELRLAAMLRPAATDAPDTGQTGGPRPDLPPETGGGWSAGIADKVKLVKGGLRGLLDTMHGGHGKPRGGRDDAGEG